MKIKFLISLIAILWFSNSYSLDNYTLLTRAGKLNSIEHLTQNKISIFGEDFCYNSSDAGATWSLPKLLNYKTAGKTCFVDSINGWSFLNEYPWNKIYKTTDGGNNWQILTSPVNDYISAILFINKNTGWAIGANGLIMKTVNSGVNWSVQRVSTSFIGIFNGIYMLNNNTGFIYSSDLLEKLWKTTDAGASWNLVNTTSVHASMQIQFIDSLNGYSLGYYGNSTFAKTTNGGLNWIDYSITSLGGNPRGMYFINLSTGWLIENYGRIYKTTNSGVNWFIQRTVVGNGMEHAYNDIYFKDLNTGWTAGKNGDILKTTNGGTNWVEQNTPPPSIEKVLATGMNNCFIISNKTNLSASLFYTTNQGVIWKELINIGNQNFNDLKITNSNNIFVCGNSGLILKSSNVGITWDINSLTDQNLLSLYFINENTGWCGGDGGKIFRTTNAGLNWEEKSMSQNSSLKSILFSDTSRGVINSSTGIYYTSNGGINWQFNPYTSSTYSYNNFFLNMDISFIVGNRVTGPGTPTTSRIMQKTTNKGVSWSTLLSESQVGVGFFFNSIYFFNEQTGYLGDGAGLRKTINSGTNWVYETLPLSTGIDEMSLVDETHGYFCSYTSVIGNFPPSGIRNIEQSSVPENILLSQNYPNPFNPSTRINYELRNSNYVTLKVFDLLGKEVGTLVNEKQNAGSYAVDFNSSEFNLPSGIYFYTLNAGEFKETKKMVLVK